MTSTHFVKQKLLHFWIFQVSYTGEQQLWLLVCDSRSPASSLIVNLFHLQDVQSTRSLNRGELDADIIAFVGQFSDISRRGGPGSVVQHFSDLEQLTAFLGGDSLLNVSGSHLPAIHQSHPFVLSNPLCSLLYMQHRAVKSPGSGALKGSSLNSDTHQFELSWAITYNLCVSISSSVKWRS